VEAGHDRFTPGPDELRHAALPDAAAGALPEMLALGRVRPENAQRTVLHDRAGLESFPAPPTASANCTARSAATCGIACIPGVPEDKVPIGHITNGIHLLGWMKGSVRQFWRKKLTEGNGETKFFREKFGADWAAALNTPNSGKR
jgi:starch phosphorylase